VRADENKALIEAFMEKMGTSQNLDEILSFWADDSVWIILVRQNGPEPIEARRRSLRSS